MSMPMPMLCNVNDRCPSIVEMAAKKSPQELLAELSAKYSPGAATAAPGIAGLAAASPAPADATTARARPPIIPPRSRTGTLTAPPPPPPPPPPAGDRGSTSAPGGPLPPLNTQGSGSGGPGHVPSPQGIIASGSTTPPPLPPPKNGGPPPLPSATRGSGPAPSVSPPLPSSSTSPTSSNGDDAPSRRGGGGGDDEYEFEEGEGEGDDGKTADRYVRGSVAEGVVKLAKTVRVFEEKAENRFVSDFVPPVRGGDPLVDSSLKSFATPSKVLMR
jgi:hypothetical protein